jgi:hypothetical protein
MVPGPVRAGRSPELLAEHVVHVRRTPEPRLLRDDLQLQRRLRQQLDGAVEPPADDLAVDRTPHTPLRNRRSSTLRDIGTRRTISSTPIPSHAWSRMNRTARTIASSARARACTGRRPRACGGAAPWPIPRSARPVVAAVPRMPSARPDVCPRRAPRLYGLRSFRRDTEEYPKNKRSGTFRRHAISDYGGAKGEHSALPRSRSVGGRRAVANERTVRAEADERELREVTETKPQRRASPSGRADHAQGPVAEARGGERAGVGDVKGRRWTNS